MPDETVAMIRIDMKQQKSVDGARVSAVVARRGKSLFSAC